MHLKNLYINYAGVSCLVLSSLNAPCIADQLYNYQHPETPEIVLIAPEAPEYDDQEELLSNTEESVWREKWKFGSLEQEIDCLAKNIYFESKGEPYVGQIAVGLTTINRLKSQRYPDSICQVVWQITKNTAGKKVPQFSWTLDGRPDEPRDETAWERSVQLATSMLQDASLDNFSDFTEGATHFHAVYVQPKWRHKMEQVLKIGLHIFYKP